MKNLKKMKALALACVLCFAMVLGACSNGQQDETQQPEQTTQSNGTTATYTVTVTDALGNPCGSGVIVRILQGGEQIAMQVVDENGVVTRDMEKGDYTVELMFTGDEDEYNYNATDLTLSADKTELQIVLTQNLKAEPVSLYVDGTEYTAYAVGAGGTSVTLIPGQRNYFLFTPEIAGTYEISAEGDVENIGYYGAPHFVQSVSSVEAVDNAFTVSVHASMIGVNGTGTTVLVVGIDAGSAEECVLKVERIGNPEYSLADEPWMVYQTTAELAYYQLPEGAQIGEFDLTADTGKYNLVYNENDGFYHLDSADGPLVLVRLAEDSKYLDSFQTILDHSGVVKYFFEEDGTFIRKESYTECLLEYLEYVDESDGVYPLTEDLKYIIQQRGDYSGWFDPQDSSYLFKDENRNSIPGINTEIAWLFMCCYMTEG